MSLLIAAVATRNSLTIYHYHIVYDLTNFTAYVYRHDSGSDPNP
jgi:hypothetical protein